ncbi:putative alanine--tRNA ligase, chloroplastic [Dendrobium catenatum]|uniref:Alanine--tRNA ligase n=1 Tax=Dendrobium catenatum TaxID=906689 RepID=A0A2I0X2U2_9ASPA|nr:putative alanine--tRNA ligase, chloroplastic [Dendrobium catenatum]
MARDLFLSSQSLLGLDGLQLLQVQPAFIMPLSSFLLFSSLPNLARIQLLCVSFMEPMHFAGKPLFSSDYFHKDRPRHVMTVATRITSVKAEPLNEDQLEVSSTDKVVSGDEIRQRFLRFYASRGHKIIPSSSLVPDDPTVLLTIAGMLQFKPVFLGKVGVPKERIKRMGEDDNFWTSGDFGDGSRFIELYNLVFMQYNKKDDGSLELLKQKNIDTGMGLERMAQVLQKVPNNYETDLIFPIIEKASNLAMISYANADDATKANFKIIGDHMRAVVYLISDGVVPSNVGRGYVVRRLIRRVVRTGKLLGIKGDVEGNIEGAFLPLLARTVIELCTNIDPDVKTRMPRILEELKREEIRFLQTLERGEKLLDQFLENALSSGGTNGDGPLLSGKDVFLLYDTYGFPVEITAEVAEERGVNIDLEGFELEMENQRRQSQAAHNVVKLTVANETELSESIPDTEFLGYSTLFASAVVKGLLVNGNPVAQVSEGFDVEIVLNRTPFYAESGGQIGDNGFLYCSRDAVARKKTVVEIKDVQKAPGGIFVHKGTIKEGTVEIGSVVDAAVDANLRKRARVHHTATHLLQAALKNVIGSETSQAGSLVAFDRLRFDFNFHRPLLEHEVLEIENLINNWIGDATDLQTMVMPLAEAKRAGAIAMFGEKYGEQVRVVEVPGVSMELCGGTHVTNTSEIRGFKIISEQGIASGIRRIEAVAGEAFIEYVNGRDTHLKNLCSMLKVRAEDVATRVDNILDELRMSRNEVLILRNKMAIMKASTVKDKAVTVGTSNIRFIVESMGDIDSDSLKSAAEYLIDSLQDPAAVVLGSCPGEGKVSLVAAFSPGVIGMGLQAGKFIGSLAKICGGGGGGRPNFAQAGGKKPENLLDALQKANSDLIAAFTDTK